MKIYHKYITVGDKNYDRKVELKGMNLRLYHTIICVGIGDEMVGHRKRLLPKAAGR